MLSEIVRKSADAGPEKEKAFSPKLVYATAVLRTCVAGRRSLRENADREHITPAEITGCTMSDRLSRGDLPGSQNAKSLARGAI